MKKQTIKNIIAFIIMIAWCLLLVLAGDSLNERLIFLTYWLLSAIIVVPVVCALIKK